MNKIFMGEAVRYNGLREVEKRLGNWEAAMQYADAYMVVYDSIQKLSDRQKLDELMDNHELRSTKEWCLSKNGCDRLFGRYRFFFLVLAGIFFFHVE